MRYNGKYIRSYKLFSRKNKKYAKRFSCHSLCLLCKYRKQCIVKYPGVTHDFTGEYDMYINKGMSPYEAWHEVMVEFAWK